jgi:hypothetical protein
VRACFEELPSQALQARGRILADLNEPFLVTSVDGLACRILNGQASRFQGRMLGSVATNNADRRIFSEATQLLQKRGRGQVYFSTSPEEGRRVPMVLKTCAFGGRTQLEVLVFPDGEHNAGMLAMLECSVLFDDVHFAHCAKQNHHNTEGARLERSVEDLCVSELECPRQQDEIFVSNRQDLFTGSCSSTVSSSSKATADGLAFGVERPIDRRIGCAQS